MTKQAALIQTQCDVAAVDLSDNITTVFDGPCVLYGVYVDTVLSGEVCPIQDGTQVVRINICLQSEDWDTTWADANSGITTANQTVAPDGTTTADTLSDDSGTGVGTCSTVQNITLATSTTYVYSVYMKADGLDWGYIGIINLGALAINAYFDLTNGVVGATTGANNTSEFIEDARETFPKAPAGWFRCGIVFTSDAADTTGTFVIRVAEADNDQTVARDGTSSIFLWGAQVEASSSVTDYIPTTDTIRGADYPVVVLPATSAAGTNIDLPGIRLSSLVVNPDDSATGDITVSYRRVNPN